jgi:hypothetical protein
MHSVYTVRLRASRFEQNSFSHLNYIPKWNLRYALRPKEATLDFKGAMVDRQMGSHDEKG